MLPGAPLNYDLGTHGPIPMRIQMVRETLLGPINNVFLPLRTASATLDGVPLTCVLTSVDGPTTAAARDWSEVEHCIEPQFGRLRVYSEAPGLYVLYDYSNPLSFHSRTLPGQITMIVAGSVVLQETLRITDPGPIDLVVHHADERDVGTRRAPDPANPPSTATSYEHDFIHECPGSDRARDAWRGRARRRSRSLAEW
jgi:hypothetical protein